MLILMYSCGAKIKHAVFPPPRSTQFIRRLLNIKDRPILLPFDPIILQHPTINPRILALKLQHRFWSHGIDNEVVVAVRTVLVGFLELLGVFAEGFAALFAGECHVCLLQERVVFRFLVAFCAVEPFPA